VAEGAVLYRCVLRAIEVIDTDTYMVTFDASRVDSEARHVVAEVPLDESVEMYCDMQGEPDARSVRCFRPCSHLDPRISDMEWFGDAESIRSVAGAVKAFDRARHLAGRDYPET
jgi:hypothetical protein